MRSKPITLAKCAAALLAFVLGSQAAHADTFEIAGTSWVNEGTEHASMCLTFETSGVLRFKGGFAEYDPGHWSKSESGFNQIQMILGGTSALPVKAFAYQLDHRRGSGLLSFDAKKRLLMYEIGIAEPIDFAGFLFYLEKDCGDVIHATATTEADSPRTALSPGAQPVDVEGINLEPFRDCSIRLWYDSERRRLLGAGIDAFVPAQAVIWAKDRYALIAVNAMLHGMLVAHVLVPTFQLRNTDGSQQNSLVLSANIGSVIPKLQAAWDLKFVEGRPEGPSPGDDEVAYYSSVPQFRPALHAEKASSPTTEVICVIEALR